MNERNNKEDVAWVLIIWAVAMTVLAAMLNG